MLDKYRATIHGNTIVWNGKVPEDVEKNDSVDVIVTLANGSVRQKVPNGARAAGALQKIADRGGVKSIPDPDAWLREIRKDRPLPGRD